jgi:hypothetical protein
MEQLLAFELDDGGTVLVEVAHDEPGIERAGRVDDLVVKARVNLENALYQVRAVADTAAARLRDPAEQPQQIQVEFGIRLNAEARAVIARTQAKDHLQVTPTWPRSGSGARAAEA